MKFLNKFCEITRPKHTKTIELSFKWHGTAPCQHSRVKKSIAIFGAPIHLVPRYTACVPGMCRRGCVGLCQAAFLRGKINAYLLVLLRLIGSSSFCTIETILITKQHFRDISQNALESKQAVLSCACSGLKKLFVSCNPTLTSFYSKKSLL